MILQHIEHYFIFRLFICLFHCSSGHLLFSPYILFPTFPHLHPPHFHDHLTDRRPVISEVRQSCDLPVLVGSGVTASNVASFGAAHGLIVGSEFKRGGR